MDYVQELDQSLTDMGDTEKKQTLLTLLKRYINPELKTYKTLTGPLAFVYLESDKYPHKICLLGDRHTVYNLKCNEAQCIHSPQFIVDYVNNSSKFIDIFYEHAYSYMHESDPGGIAWGKNYLEESMETFNPECYKIIKDKCDLTTTRLHYTDMRHYFNNDEEQYIAASIMDFPNRIWLHKSYKTNSKEATEDAAILVLEVMDAYGDEIGSYDFLKSMFTGGIREERILKQIANIPNNDIKNYIGNYYLTNSTTLINKMIAINLSNIKTMKEIYIHFKPLIRFGRILLDLYSLYMDIYLLARIFRIYKDVPSKYSEGAYNSFVYTGLKHTNRYIEILTELGFYSVFSKHVDKSESKLIDISNLKQPLFHRDLNVSPEMYSKGYELNGYKVKYDVDCLRSVRHDLKDALLKPPDILLPEELLGRYLLSLDPTTLRRACNSNKIYSTICNQNKFWWHKMRLDFNQQVEYNDNNSYYQEWDTKN